MLKETYVVVSMHYVAFLIINYINADNNIISKANIWNENVVDETKAGNSRI